MEIHTNGKVINVTNSTFDMVDDALGFIFRVKTEANVEIDDQLFVIGNCTGVTLSEGKILIEMDEEYLDEC